MNISVPHTLAGMATMNQIESRPASCRPSYVGIHVSRPHSDSEGADQDVEPSIDKESTK